MPISRELFDQNLDPLDVAILDVLNTDPENAYTFEELASTASVDTSDPSNWLDLLFRLGLLDARGLLLQRTINGVRYFASVKQPEK
jgi:hypothetical protein